MYPGPDTVPRALHILSHLMKWKQSGRNSLCCIMPNLQKFPSYLSNLSLILKFINFSALIMGYTYHSKPMLMFGLICLYFCKNFTPEIMLFFIESLIMSLLLNHNHHISVYKNNFPQILIFEGVIKLCFHFLNSFFGINLAPDYSPVNQLSETNLVS